MNQNLADAYYDELLNILREVGLQWVAEQVEAEAREGLVVEKLKEVLGHDIGEEFQLRELTLQPEPRSARSIGLTIRTLTSLERLRIIINAIQAVTLDRELLERKSLQIITQRLNGEHLSPGVLFADEDDDSPRVFARRVGPPSLEEEAAEELTQQLSFIRDRFRLTQ